MSGFHRVAVRSEIIAAQATLHNLEEIAQTFRGKVCGVKLPREQQFVRLDDPWDGEELTVDIGDWVVRLGDRAIVFNDTQYHATFASLAFEQGPLPA
jgi:hypothetical protein